MSKRAKSMIIFASLYFLGFAGVLGYALYLVHVEGDALEAERVLMSEHAAKEAAYNAVVRLTESTKSERAELETYFIAEKDTVTFIAGIEEAAKRMNLKFETTGLSVVPAGKDTQAELVVDCTFSGNAADVETYITFLENLPYHMVMPQLSVTNKTDTETKTEVTVGSAQFKITLKP